MEIKVGEYIRTEEYGIIKLKEMYFEEGNLNIIDDKNNGYTFYDIGDDELVDNLSKHSPNIIDLIEIGDYVNGCKVIDIVKGYKVIIDKLELDTTTGIYKNIGIKDIKTIVTHEQFKGMEYKV